MFSFDDVKNFDPEVAQAMEQELERQRTHIELIASENLVSKAVMAAMGSHLTNKYAEGYPGKRYYGGCEYVDIVEDLARERAKKLFGCDYVNVQPHSGAQANFAAFFAIVKPGDTVMGMSLDQAGASAYPREIDFKKFREIADEVGAVLMVDMAHIAGLVAAGLHMSPIPYADVVTTTTHKTLRGPRGGMILCNQEAADKYNFNKAVFPGIQGGPLMHVIAGKAVCFKEALDPSFKTYMQGVKDNAAALAKDLMARDFNLVSGGTDNHLMLVDLRNKGVTGKVCEKLLDAANITCNKNAIPNDPEKPFVTSGIRIGTPAITSRGMNVQDMDLIAEAISLLVSDAEANKAKAMEIVKGLTDKYPLYE